MHRKHDYRNVRELLADGANEVDAGIAAERQIDNREIRVGPCNPFQRAFGVDCAVTDHEVWSLIDQSGKPFAYQRMIIGTMAMRGIA